MDFKPVGSECEPWRVDSGAGIEHDARMRTTWIALVCAACFPFPARAGWAPPQTGELAALGVVEGLIVLDVLQTKRAFARGSYEGNWMYTAAFRDSRSTAKLFVFGGAGAIATAGAFYLLPSPWRDFFIAGVGGAEVGVILTSDQAIYRLRF